jgi:DNA-binding transcriptional LysR family regulator
MNLRHIEAFRAVMMTGSMTEAARRMHTSQPQISRLISQLEAIAQFSLFDRKGSRFTPTSEGAKFFQDVEKTFVGLEGLESSAANIRAFKSGRLSVAAMPRLAGGLLTRIVARFKADYPDVMVSIHSGTSSAVHNWITTGLCDAGLAMLYDDPANVQVEALHSTHFVAVLPKSHRLAKRKHLKPEDFAGEAFVSFASGSPLRSRIDQIFTGIGVERRTVVETDLGTSVCALVAAGLGISLINPLAAQEERDLPGIAIRRFIPAVPITIALLYPPYATHDRLVNIFAEYVRKITALELKDL